MLTYAAKRLIYLVPILLGGATIIFLMVYLIPGDPVAIMLEELFTRESYEAVQAKLGLDKPMHVQYARFLSNIVQGDLGRSFRSQLPVLQIIRSQLPFTIELALASVIISVLLGIPVGIYAALNRSRPGDYLTMMGSLLSVCVPNFVLGILLLYVFSLQLGWFPTIGAGNSLTARAYSLVLPATAMGLRSAALLARIARSSLLNVLALDYVRTARAKGLPERVVIYKHALRNAILPVITVIGLNFGLLLGGTTITEIVFSRPGLGKVLIAGVLSRDLPIVQGSLLVYLVMVSIINICVDIAYGFADPQLRFD